jgi:hypothetical protein
MERGASQLMTITRIVIVPDPFTVVLLETCRKGIAAVHCWTSQQWHHEPLAL